MALIGANSMNYLMNKGIQEVGNKLEIDILILCNLGFFMENGQNKKIVKY